jgi:hypothetical protein
MPNFIFITLDALGRFRPRSEFAPRLTPAVELVLLVRTTSWLRDPLPVLLRPCWALPGVLRFCLLVALVLDAVAEGVLLGVFVLRRCDAPDASSDALELAPADVRSEFTAGRVGVPPPLGLPAARPRGAVCGLVSAARLGARRVPVSLFCREARSVRSTSPSSDTGRRGTTPPSCESMRSISSAS